MKEKIVNIDGKNYRCDEDRVSLDETYLQMAELWGTCRSYGIRAKVGTLIVMPGIGIISDGYNGMPVGEPNYLMEIQADDGSWYTNPEAIHAESNALLKLTQRTEVCTGATMYQTFSPCSGCVKLIKQARIARIVFREYFRDTVGLPSLLKAGIELVHLKRKP